MPLSVQCPQCGQAYTVPETLAGKQAKCKKCNGVIAIPGGPVRSAPATQAPTTAQPSSPSAQAAPQQPTQAGPQMFHGQPLAPSGFPQTGFAQPGMAMGGMPHQGLPSGFQQTPYGMGAGGMGMDMSGLGMGGPMPGMGGFDAMAGASGGAAMGGFASTSFESSGGKRRRSRSGSTTAPGIALLIAGVLTFLAHLGVAGFMLFLPIPPQDQMNPQQLEARNAAITFIYSYAACIGFLGVLFGVLIGLGGLKLWQRSAYGLALTGCIAAMAPCTIVWLITLPIGIWAMIVTTQNKSRFD